MRLTYLICDRLSTAVSLAILVVLSESTVALSIILATCLSVGTDLLQFAGYSAFEIGNQLHLPL